MATRSWELMTNTLRRSANEVALGCEGIKPGWIRVNFNYFISDSVFEFITEAVNLVATHGWKLLPWYRFDTRNR